MTADGWTAEMRIPYSQLRFASDAGADVGTAGLALRRSAQRAGHVVVPAPQRERRAGVLRSPRGPRHRPTARARRSCCRTSCRADSSSTPSRAIRIARSSDDETQRRCRRQVQPHVEPHARRHDQPRLRPGRSRSRARSISRPTRVSFDEKRPFFVANRSAFSFGGTELHQLQQHVEPQRVLLAAHRTSAAAQRLRERRPPLYADAPDDATILGAAKITGRTNNGYTIGTARCRHRTARQARFVTTLGGTERDADRGAADELLRGPSEEGVSRRARRRSAASSTSAVRALDGDTLLTDRLREQCDARSASTGVTRGAIASIAGAVRSWRRMCAAHRRPSRSRSVRRRTTISVPIAK